MLLNNPFKSDLICKTIEQMGHCVRSTWKFVVKGDQNILGWEGTGLVGGSAPHWTALCIYQPILVQCSVDGRC